MYHDYCGREIEDSEMDAYFEDLAAERKQRREKEISTMLLITKESVAAARERLTNGQESYFLRSLQASTKTIEEAPYSGEARHIYTLGVLRGMFSNLAGLSGLEHEPLFDEATTEALRGLVNALEVLK